MMLFKPSLRRFMDSPHVGSTLPSKLIVSRTKLRWRSAAQPRDYQAGHIPVNGISVLVVCAVNTWHFRDHLVEDFAFDEILDFVHTEIQASAAISNARLAHSLSH